MAMIVSSSPPSRRSSLLSPMPSDCNVTGGGGVAEGSSTAAASAVGPASAADAKNDTLSPNNTNNSISGTSSRRLEQQTSGINGSSSQRASGTDRGGEGGETPGHSGSAKSPSINSSIYSGRVGSTTDGVNAPVNLSSGDPPIGTTDSSSNQTSFSVPPVTPMTSTQLELLPPHILQLLRKGDVTPHPRRLSPFKCVLIRHPLHRDPVNDHMTAIKDSIKANGFTTSENSPLVAVRYSKPVAIHTKSAGSGRTYVHPCWCDHPLVYVISGASRSEALGHLLVKDAAHPNVKSKQKGLSFFVLNSGEELSAWDIFQLSTALNAMDKGARPPNFVERQDQIALIGFELSRRSATDATAGDIVIEICFNPFFSELRDFLQLSSDQVPLEPIPTDIPLEDPALYNQLIESRNLFSHLPAGFGVAADVRAMKIASVGGPPLANIRQSPLYCQCLHELMDLSSCINPERFKHLEAAVSGAKQSDGSVRSEGFLHSCAEDQLRSLFVNVVPYKSGANFQSTTFHNLVGVLFSSIQSFASKTRDEPKGRLPDTDRHWMERIQHETLPGGQLQGLWNFPAGALIVLVYVYFVNGVREFDKRTLQKSFSVWGLTLFSYLAELALNVRHARVQLMEVPSVLQIRVLESAALLVRVVGFGSVRAIDFPEHPGSITAEDVDTSIHHEGGTVLGSLAEVRDFIYNKILSGIVLQRLSMDDSFKRPSAPELTTALPLPLPSGSSPIFTATGNDGTGAAPIQPSNKISSSAPAGTAAAAIAGNGSSGGIGGNSMSTLNNNSLTNSLNHISNGNLHYSNPNSNSINSSSIGLNAGLKNSALNGAAVGVSASTPPTGDHQGNGTSAYGIPPNSSSTLNSSLHINSGTNSNSFILQQQPPWYEARKLDVLTTVARLEHEAECGGGDTDQRTRVKRKTRRRDSSSADGYELDVLDASVLPMALGAKLELLGLMWKVVVVMLSGLVKQEVLNVPANMVVLATLKVVLTALPPHYDLLAPHITRWQDLRTKLAMWMWRGCRVELQRKAEEIFQKSVHERWMQENLKRSLIAKSGGPGHPSMGPPPRTKLEVRFNMNPPECNWIELTPHKLRDVLSDVLEETVPIMRSFFERSKLRDEETLQAFFGQWIKSTELSLLPRVNGALSTHAASTSSSGGVVGDRDGGGISEQSRKRARPDDSTLPLSANRIATQNINNANNMSQQFQRVDGVPGGYQSYPGGAPPPFPPSQHAAAAAATVRLQHLEAERAKRMRAKASRIGEGLELLDWLDNLTPTEKHRLRGQPMPKWELPALSCVPPPDILRWKPPEILHQFSGNGLRGPPFNWRDTPKAFVKEGGGRSEEGRPKSRTGDKRVGNTVSDFDWKVTVGVLHLLGSRGIDTLVSRSKGEVFNLTRNPPYRDFYKAMETPDPTSDDDTGTNPTENRGSSKGDRRTSASASSAAAAASSAAAAAALQDVNTRVSVIPRPTSHSQNKITRRNAADLAASKKYGPFKTSHDLLSDDAVTDPIERIWDLQMLRGFLES